MFSDFTLKHSLRVRLLSYSQRDSVSVSMSQLFQEDILISGLVNLLVFYIWVILLLFLILIYCEKWDRPAQRLAL